MWNLEFSHPSNITLGLVLVLIILFVYTGVRYKRLVYLLLLLRVSFFILLVLILFKPVKLVRSKMTDKPMLAILIDNSESMMVSDPVPRNQYVDQFLKGKLVANLNSTYRLAIHPFSDKLDPENRQLNYTGKTTDLGRALNEVYERYKNSLQGIIIVTDGAHNGQIEPLSQATSMDIPIYPVGVGNTTISDLAIEEISHIPLAFKNVPVDVTVTITSTGLPEREIPITLQKNVKGHPPIIIQSQKVKLPPEARVPIKFKFTNEEIGDLVYTFKIPEYQEELIKSNNTRNFVVPTIREKIRILYICGQINPEYAFLRNLIKGDPSLELVSFVILRNPENIAFVPDDQLSLIPFPAQEIFIKQLFQFDLLILENFTYHRFGIPQEQLSYVARFIIEKGGGLIVIGGDNAFGRGGYKGTPLADLLPVELAGIEEKIIPGTFNLQIENYTHPITNQDNWDTTRKIWTEMPDLDSCNVVGPVRSGALVLATHPTATTSTETKVPVLSVLQKGLGRVMCLASNTTWRWAMGLAARGKSTDPYFKFWQNAIRWTTQAKELKMVRVSTEKTEYVRGDKIPFLIRVYDETYRPYPTAKLNVNLSSSWGKNYTLNQRVYSIRPGEFQGEIETDTVGEFTLSVRAEFPSGKLIDEDKLILQVKGINEMDNLQLNEPLLNEIARVTKGKYVHFTELDKTKLSFPARTLPIKKKIYIWHLPYIYFIGMVLLCLEWLLRKKKGLF